MLSYNEINKSLEVNRRISLSEEKEINDQLEKLPDIQHNITNLQSTMDSPEWNSHSILGDHLMPFYALMAYQNGYIDLLPFATLLLYWAVRQAHNLQEIEIHFIFDKEKGEASQAILKESLLYRHPRDTLFPTFYFTEEKFQTFIEAIKKLPISEQRFFLVVPSFECSIVNILEGQFVGFRVLGTINNKYMIASAGIMQTYLNIQFGVNAFTMNPVIGYSSIMDIRNNGLTNQRDFALHFPHVFLPIKADGHLAKWYLFSKHDFYHAASASNIAIAHRHLFIMISDAIKNDIEQRLNLLEIHLKFDTNILKKIKKYLSDEIENEFIEHFYNYFIDMEGAYYALRLHNTIEDNFWMMIQGALYALRTTFEPRYFNSLFFKLFETLVKENQTALIAVIDSNFSEIRKKQMSDIHLTKFNLMNNAWNQFKSEKTEKAEKAENIETHEKRASLTYCGEDILLKYKRARS